MMLIISGTIHQMLQKWVTKCSAVYEWMALESSNLYTWSTTYKEVTLLICQRSKLRGHHFNTVQIVLVVVLLTVESGFQWKVWLWRIRGRQLRQRMCLVLLTSETWQTAACCETSKRHSHWPCMHVCVWSVLSMYSLHSKTSLYGSSKTFSQSSLSWRNVVQWNSGKTIPTFYL